MKKDRVTKFQQDMYETERLLVMEYLEKHDFNILRTAEDIGINRNTLAKKLRQYREDGFVVPRKTFGRPICNEDIIGGVKITY